MTVLNLQVAAGADDAHQQRNGPMNVTASSVTTSYTDWWIGFRFVGTSVPVGAVIDSAILQVFLLSTFTDSPNYNIYCQDVDDTVAFSTTSFDISNRAFTTAFIPWVSTDIGTGWKSAPGIASVVQEVIDRPQFAGNSLVVGLKGLSTTDYINARSYEGDPSQAAKLDITYTEGGGGGGGAPIPVFMNHYRQMGIA